MLRYLAGMGLHRRYVWAPFAIVLGLASSHQALAGSSVQLDHCVISIAGARIAVTGTISTEPLSVDLVGYTARWTLGALTLRDVVATARDHGDAIRACVAGTVGDTRLLACGVLPRSSTALRSLRGVDAKLQISGPTAHGRGTARIAWTQAGSIRIERSHAELALSEHPTGPLTAEGATVRVDASGSLSNFDLEVTGEARASALAVGALRVHDVTLPIALRATTGEDGALAIAPRGAIVARAREAALRIGTRRLSVPDPELVVHDAQPFAIGALLGEVHVLSWPALAGLPVDVEDGAIAFRMVPDGVRIEHGRLRALGAELSTGAVTIGAGSVDLAIDARGLDLAQVLAIVGRGRVEASGLLDGQVAVRADDHGLAITSAALRSRHAGGIRVPAFDWSKQALASVTGIALHSRIVATLADFAYDRLSIELHPRGAEPEARVVMSGHAKRLAQELDLVVNLRGVRDVTQELIGRVER